LCVTDRPIETGLPQVEESLLLTLHGLQSLVTHCLSICIVSQFDLALYGGMIFLR
jgi:hypothetical protein